MDDPKRNASQAAARYGAFMGIGIELVVLVVAAAYLGKFIDDRFQSPGYWTAGLILVFLVSWFYHLVILLRRLNREDETSERNEL